MDHSQPEVPTASDFKEVLRALSTQDLVAILDDISAFETDFRVSNILDDLIDRAEVVATAERILSRHAEPVQTHRQMQLAQVA